MITPVLKSGMEQFPRRNPWWGGKKNDVSRAFDEQILWYQNLLPNAQLDICIMINYELMM